MIREVPDQKPTGNCADLQSEQEDHKKLQICNRNRKDMRNVQICNKKQKTRGKQAFL